MDSGESRDPKPAPGYAEARYERQRASISIRLFGVPLESNEPGAAAIIIWYCGFSVDGADQRECTKRILHIPQASVSASGVTRDFVCDGYPVKWFDVARNALLIEESYRGFDIASLAGPPPAANSVRRLSILERLHGTGSPSIFGGAGGIGEVPIIIPPGSPLPPGPVVTPIQPIPVVIQP